MREFHLIDLSTQLTYLPHFMREWNMDEILSWLKIYGEVIDLQRLVVEDRERTHSDFVEGLHRSPIEWYNNHYIFRSWWGFSTTFILSPGNIILSHGYQSAWGKSSTSDND
jgi:hypothetical protein